MIKEATLIALPIEFFQLRVLLWKERDIYVGQCLETGSVATADDTDTLKSIMQELLTDEVEYNINGDGSAGNLFGTPAPLQLWQQYFELSRNRNADLVDGINMLDATF